MPRNFIGLIQHSTTIFFLFAGQKNIGLNLIGTIGALLVCLVWLVFLRRLDIFEPEKWKYSILATLLGVGSTLVLLVLISIPPLADFEANGEPLHDFLFYTFRVGFVEEVVKFVPLLIMARFTNEVNEPYDFLKYAMCSALGFATLENMLYFNEHGSPIIDKRAYISVVGHLAFTCCLAYGYIRQHFLQKGAFLYNLLFFGGLGVLAHGLFDFLLSTEWLGGMARIGFVVLAYFLVLALRNLIAQALNFSPWFKEEQVNQIESAFGWLLGGLILVFCYAALGVYLEMGRAEAISFIQGNLLLSGSLIFFLPRFFARIRLERNRRIRIFQRSQ